MMIWGKYTWYLFHTLAEKIRDDMFDSHKHVVTGIIANLCRCLPCPTCKEHAIDTLRKKNINAVRNKHELKLFLYQFHNTVSRRKGMPVPDMSILDQYRHANLRRIVPVFRKHFSTNVPGLMAQQMQRRAILNQCMNNLQSHWHIFDQ